MTHRGMEIIVVAVGAMSSHRIPRRLAPRGSVERLITSPLLTPIALALALTM
jgi:hypothetical protein